MKHNRMHLIMISVMILSVVLVYAGVPAAALLFLACPIMMIFMMALMTRGMHGARRQGSESRAEGDHSAGKHL